MKRVFCRSLLSLCFLAFAAPFLLAQHLLTTIPVGTFPTGMALNRITQRLYVANALSNSVSVIDTAANSVVTTIPVGNFPQAVVVYIPADLVLVNNGNDKTLSVIDGNTNTVLKTVPLPFGFEATAQLGRSKFLYVTDLQASQVHVLDVVALKKTADINVANPQFIAANSAAKLVYVSNESSDITVIDTTTNQVVNTFNMGANNIADAMSADPETNLLYVGTHTTASAKAFVSVLDATTGATLGSSDAVGTVNQILALPGRNKAVLSGGRTEGRFVHSLIFISGTTFKVAGVVAVGNAPWGLAFNPVTGTVYAGNQASNNVAVVGR